MNSVHFSFLLVAIIIILITSAKAETASQTDQLQDEPSAPAVADIARINKLVHDTHATDWKKDHYKVYSFQGDPMKPEETLDLLKNLKNLYADRLDKGSIIRSSKVSNLLEASEISEDKCNSDDLDRLISLLEQNSIYRVNLVPYLGHFLAQQFNQCVLIFNSRLTEKVAKLPKEDVRLVTSLGEKVLKISNISKKPESGVLAEAALNFIEDVQGLFNKRLMCTSLKVATFHLRPKFDLVVDSCSQVVEGLEEFVNNYEKIMSQKEIPIKVDDEFASSLINSVEFCRRIEEDEEGIRLEASRKLFEKCNKFTGVV